MANEHPEEEMKGKDLLERIEAFFDSAAFLEPVEKVWHVSSFFTPLTLLPVLWVPLEAVEGSRVEGIKQSSCSGDTSS